MDIGSLLNKIVENNISFSIHYGVISAITTTTVTTTATGSVSTATKAVTLSAPNAAIVPGMSITGTNISANTYVYSINGADLIMTNVGASINATASLSFSINNPSRVSLRLSGSSTAITGIRFISSYVPVVSDVVVCLVDDGDIIVLGKLT